MRCLSITSGMLLRSKGKFLISCLLGVSLSVTVVSRLSALPEAKVSLYQESRTTTSTDNKANTVTRKVWIKQPGRFRMEETSGALARITVSNGGDFWMADPSRKRGLHKKLSAADIKTLDTRLKVDVDALPKFVHSGAKKTGQEKVNGVLCDVYKHTTRENMTFTLWVATTGLRLAQKQQTEGIVRAAEKVGDPMKTHILKSTTDYLKWQIDQPIDDSLFHAPAGVTYQEFKPGAVPPGGPKR